MRLIDADALKGCACTVMEVGVADTYAPRSTFSAVPVRFIDEQPTVEVPRWIPVAERLPEKEEFVLVVVNGRWHNIKFVNAAQIAMYDEDGWWIEAYPEWKNPKVSHWMSLPSAPEVE